MQSLPALRGQITLRPSPDYGQDTSIITAITADHSALPVGYIQRFANAPKYLVNVDVAFGFKNIVGIICEKLAKQGHFAHSALPNES